MPYEPYEPCDYRVERNGYRYRSADEGDMPSAPPAAPQWGDPETRYRFAAYPREADQPPVGAAMAYEVDDGCTGSRVEQLVTALRDFMESRGMVRLDDATANVTGLLPRRTLNEQAGHFYGKSRQNQRAILRRLREVISGERKQDAPTNAPNRREHRVVPLSRSSGKEWWGGQRW